MPQPDLRTMTEADVDVLSAEETAIAYRRACAALAGLLAPRRRRLVWRLVLLTAAAFVAVCFLKSYAQYAATGAVAFLFMQTGNTLSLYRRGAKRAEADLARADIPAQECRAQLKALLPLLKL